MIEWKPVVGFEGFYEVSLFGVVRSLSRSVDRHWATGATWVGTALEPRLHSQGYHRVQLSKLGVSVDRYIHRLVAEAFLPNPDRLPYVNHINGVKTDNSIGNLEWVTPTRNSQHSYESGLNKRMLLTVYSQDGSILYEGKAVSELKGLGFTPSAVYRCLQGRLKKHKSCTFKLLESSNV